MWLYESLNYFFGTATMPNGSGSGSRKGGPLPDLSEMRPDNPLSGRRGLEGNAAAFDMRSLEKHIDAVSLYFECGAEGFNGRRISVCHG